MINLTKPQRKALHRKWLHNNQNMTYKAFRQSVQPEICGPAVMVLWGHMWLGIEPDGYTHS